MSPVVRRLAPLALILLATTPARAEVGSGADGPSLAEPMAAREAARVAEADATHHRTRETKARAPDPDASAFEKQSTVLELRVGLGLGKAL